MANICRRKRDTDNRTRALQSTKGLLHCPKILWTWVHKRLKTRGGRVPGDYPVPARCCTTRHYPDPAGYYFNIWPDPDPGNFCRFFCDFQLYLTQSNAMWAFVLRPCLMHDTVASCVTDNCPLGPSRERADGNLLRDGLLFCPSPLHTLYVALMWRPTATLNGTALASSAAQIWSPKCYRVGWP